jgi:hypothetical protein
VLAVAVSPPRQIFRSGVNRSRTSQTLAYFVPQKHGWPGRRARRGSHKPGHPHPLVNRHRKPLPRVDLLRHTEIVDPNSAFFPVAGIVVAFLMVFAYQIGREDEDKYSSTWWGQSIGAAFGIGLLFFTPILFVIFV